MDKWGIQTNQSNDKEIDEDVHKDLHSRDGIDNLYVSRKGRGK